MSGRSRVIVLLLLVLSLGQGSCFSPNHDPLRLSLENHLAEAIERAYQEAFSSEELAFWKFASEHLKEREKDHEFLRDHPHVARSSEMCFTYPRSTFPGALPDGIWMVEIVNRVVPDSRFLREPVGKESRGRKEGTVQHIGTFARQRGDCEQPIGELTVLGEVLQEADGRIEYRLYSERIVARHDESTGQWVLVSEFVRPVGELPS